MIFIGMCLFLAAVTSENGAVGTILGLASSLTLTVGIALALDP